MLFAKNTDGAHAEQLIPLKRAVWIYLLLLVFEGALRKWLLPALATPLLLVRDPIAIYILFQGLRHGLVPRSPMFFISLFLGLLACGIAVFFGHGSLFVAAYGARPLLLHFPAMFVMALALDREDILRIGKLVMVLSLAMSILIAIQFYLPQTAFVNRGVGGEGTSAGFQGAMGYYRPSGTFSFTSGVAQFYALAAAYVLYFWLTPGRMGRGLVWAATIALIVALPFSVSRTLLFQTLLAAAFGAIAALSQPKLLKRSFFFALAIIAVIVLVYSLGIFQTAIDVMQARFDLASKAEGGLEGTLGDRYIGGLLSAFTIASDWPLFGMGIGMGTNVGAILLSGQANFLIAEGEWQRWVGEIGVLGFFVIGMRLWVTGSAAISGAIALLRGDILPWLLLSNAVTVLPQGSWNQPTALGFSIMAGALLLASLKQTRSRGYAFEARADVSAQRLT